MMISSISSASACNLKLRVNYFVELICKHNFRHSAASMSSKVSKMLASTPYRVTLGEVVIWVQIIEMCVNRQTPTRARAHTHTHTHTHTHARARVQFTTHSVKDRTWINYCLRQHQPSWPQVPLLAHLPAAT